MPGHAHGDMEGDATALRADAQQSRRRILQAGAVLRADRRVTMGEIAAAANVGRSTLYRHFPTREVLEQALDEADAPTEQPESASVTELPFTAPGHLGRQTPLALEVTRVLEEVPAHLVPEQLVAEARRAAGVAVALYVVDIDGSHLLRLAGSTEFPERLSAPPALGPEIVPEGLPAFREQLQEVLPGCACQPLWLRGRVMGMLLCLGRPLSSLEDIAKQGAAALELSSDYTDFIESARRRKPTTPAAEIQQNLFPPRIARIAGAQVAGVLLPSYEVGGDWFDFVENRDGAWLAIADAAGTGPTAAGLGAAALGALRAARRAGEDLEGACRLMDETIRHLEHPDFSVSLWLARWRPATAMLTWINCSHPGAYLVDCDGELIELDSGIHEPLGAGRKVTGADISRRQLHSGERLVLVTDGVLHRRVRGGGQFGLQGLRDALATVPNATAAATALAIQGAVTDSWQEPLEDDATIVVMAVG